MPVLLKNPQSSCKIFRVKNMLFKEITILDENFNIKENMYVGVRGDRIVYVSNQMPEENFGEIRNGKGRLLMPGFVNSHAHAPMGLMRGYGENMALQDWLFKKIFPFEDKLTSEGVYYATLLSMAECMRFGIVSTSEMYYFMDEMAAAVTESGMKSNLSRSISHFDDSDFMSSYRAKEMIDAYEKYNGAAEGRIIIDMSLHSEYTSTPESARQLAEYTKSIGARMQVHVSETKKEHEECKEKYNMTPVKYLNSLGIFDTPSTAAHCVWIEENDRDILKEKGVSVCVNPISNLKLASGICDIPKLLDKGINITIGTDSAASNNCLDFMEEIKMFALLPKLVTEDPTVITPKQALMAATVNGAMAQGRTDCGCIKEGNKADLIMLNTDVPWMHPKHDLLGNIVYAARGSDVVMTMVDGRVLYENGVYKTLDIEKVIYETEKATKEILAEI